jgi:prepilin-type N-terminal cleavage/methylation domain-containing protein
VKQHLRQREGGFTIVELMIVVAVISVISSIAVPEFSAMSRRARNAERSVMMGTMATVMKDYFNEQSEKRHLFVFGAAVNPPLVGGKATPEKKLFAAGVVGWDQIGFVQDTPVWHHYSISAFLTAGLPATFVISAVGDVDGDAVESSAVVTWTQSSGAWGPVLDLTGDEF